MIDGGRPIPTPQTSKRKKEINHENVMSVARLNHDFLLVG
jgi:hypothetical protein